LNAYQFGYGDKEHFWISATAGKDAFAFEPFISGQFGDCFGVVMHSHPEDRDKVMANPEYTARPLYLNSEFVMEEMQFVGHWVFDVMTKPMLVTDDRVSTIVENDGFHTWRKGNRGSRNCTCGHVLECTPTTPEVESVLLLHQWIALSDKVKTHRHRDKHDAIRDHQLHDHSSDISIINSNTNMKTATSSNNFNVTDDYWKDCVEVQASSVALLGKTLQSLSPTAMDALCATFGCPAFPIAPLQNMNTERGLNSPAFCQKVCLKPYETVSPSAEDQLQQYIVKQTPIWNLPEGSLVQHEQQRTIYLLKDGLFRPIDGLPTFYKLGRDFSEVVKVNMDFLCLPTGPELTENDV